jgi:hypothetical protein
VCDVEWAFDPNAKPQKKLAEKEFKPKRKKDKSKTAAPKSD